jgi:hypothetical protein
MSISFSIDFLSGAPVESRLDVLKGIEITSGKLYQVPKIKQKHGTVVLFLSSVCPCTNGAIEKISELIKKYKSKGFEMVVVNLDHKGKLSSLESYYKKTGIQAPIIWDDQLKIAKSFNVKMMAEAVILSKSDEIIYQGGIRTEDDQYPLISALDEIISEKKISVPKGKGMGCLLLYPNTKSP